MCRRFPHSHWDLTKPWPFQVLSKGTANRKIGSHELNMESSRSHSIATVYCETGGGDTGKIPCFGKISFVDLAGSERVKDTRTQGGMLKETNAINRSLFTLGKASCDPHSDPPSTHTALHCPTPLWPNAGVGALIALPASKEAALL